MQFTAVNVLTMKIIQFMKSGPEALCEQILVCVAT